MRAMSSLVFVVVLMAAISVPAQSVAVNNTRRIAPTVVNTTGEDEICPSQEVKNNAYRTITEGVRTILQDIVMPVQDTDECGAGPWTRVALINMTETSNQCPGDWELTTFSKRTCARSVDDNGCNSATFSTGGQQYSRVCGRIIGYQYGTTSAFYWFYKFPDRTIEDVYCDGVSITYGPAGSRQHIWTFAAGYLEDLIGYSPEQCPCDMSSPVDVPP